MQTPHVFVAQAKARGLECAVAYLESQRDAYGWFAAMQEMFAREWLTVGEGSVRVQPDRLHRLRARSFYSRNFERPAAAQKRRHAKHARP